MRKKVGLIVSLLLGCVVSVSLSLVSLFAGAESSALDGTKVVTITSGEATVDAGNSKTGDEGKVTHTGLLIEPKDSATAYSGRINGVFMNDTRIEYVFPGKTNAGTTYDQNAVSGHFVFRIANAVNPEEYFEVGVRDGLTSSRAAMYVTYQDQYRSRENSGGNMMNSPNNERGYNVFGNDDHSFSTTVDATINSSYIDLRWEDGCLAVYTFANRYNAEVLLAKFDGTYDAEDSAKGFNKYTKKWGLPKLNFPHGYIVSFEAKNNIVNGAVAITPAGGVKTSVPVTPIKLKALQGITLDGETLSTEPVWYTDYAGLDSYKENAVNIAFAEGEAYESSYAVGATVNILSATYTKPYVQGDFVATPVSKIELYQGEEFIADLTEQASYTFSEKGRYILKYTAIVDGIGEGNVKEQVINIIDDIYDLVEEDVEITLKEDYNNLSTQGNTVKVVGATFLFVNLPSIEEQEVSSIVAIAPSGMEKTVNEGDTLTFTEVGTYIIRYTAIQDSIGQGNVKDVKIIVDPMVESGFNMQNAIVLTNGGASYYTADSKTGAAGIVTHTGLLVEPKNEKTAYSGQFNGIFMGNTKVEYIFPGATTKATDFRYNDVSGHFVFRITSVVNPNEYFEIGIRDGITARMTAMYVTYQDQYRSREYSGGAMMNAPGNERGYNTFGNDDYDYTSYIDLRWEDGKLGVYTYMRHYSAEVLIAQFDGTYSETDSKKGFNKDTGAWGLPLLDFSQGYIISFESKTNIVNEDGKAAIIAANAQKDSVPATPVKFKSIQGVALTVKSLEVVPEWYQNMEEKVVISLVSEYPPFALAPESIEIIAATYSHYIVQADEPKAVAKIEVSHNGGAFIEKKVGDKLTELGSYVIRYTSVEGGSTLEVRVYVIDNYADIKDKDVYININGLYSVTNFIVGDKINILSATFTFSDIPSILPQNVFKIEIVNEQGETVLVTADGDYVFVEAGVYFVRYTAISDGTGNGNVHEVEVLVLEEYNEFTADRTIFVDGKYGDALIGQIKIKPATYSYPSIPEIPDTLVEKIMISKDGGAFEDVDVGYVVNQAGNYTVKYIACISGSTNNVGNEITFAFEVFEEGFNYNDVITIEKGNPTITAGDRNTSFDTKGVSYTHEGLLITPQDICTPYAGTFNTVFSADNGVETTVKFSIPGLTPTYEYRGNLVFRIADATNPDNYFEIVIVAEDNVYSRGLLAVTYQGAYRVTTNNDGTIYPYEVKKKTGYVYFGSDITGAAYFKIVNEDGILSVYANVLGKTTDHLVARFDGADAIDSTANPRKYALPKIAFPDGYTISFESKESGDGVRPIRFESIGSTVLSEYATDTINVESFTLVNEANLVVAASSDDRTAAEMGLGAVVRFTTSLGDLTFSKQQYVYPDISGIDFKIEGTHALTYEYLGQTIQQTLIIEKVPPIMQFANGESEIVVRDVGESVLTLSTNDVVAIDLVDGVVDANNITIWILAPNGVDYQQITEGDYTYTQFGIYKVKYIANGSELIRTVKIVDGMVPQISIGVTIPDTMLLGSTMQVPTGSATDNGVALTGEMFIRNVYFEQELLVLENNLLTFNRAGKYTISYFAKDADGNESVLRYTVMVYADETLPEITFGDIPSQVVVGSTVDCSSATAIDDVDGTLTVIVSVKYGNEQITVTRNKFIASKEGYYVITFEATDSAGNTAVVKKEIEVRKTLTSDSVVPDNATTQPPQNETESENEVGATTEETTESQQGGCTGSLQSNAMALVSLLLVAAVFMFERKKKIIKK